MTWDVKQNLRWKSKFVADWYHLDVIDDNIYSSTVKDISVELS